MATPITWKAKRAAYPEWVCGTVKTPAGEFPKVATEWSRADRIGQIRCRMSGLRMKYTVEPGLYAVGDPDDKSDVFSSANYKLSFDILRRSLKGMNAWILVLDTKGINVWCAAGKGTFGTRELVGRIKSVGLERVVSHKRIILPQLGAPGVRAHEVGKLTGFRVYFGPVQAGDIPAYVNSRYKADKGMRTIEFPLTDRLVLTPMEIIPAMKRYPYFALAVILIFGLQKDGILFREAVGSLPFLFAGFIAVMAGALVTPLLLPIVPFRSFALKGLLVGILCSYLSVRLTGINDLLLAGFSYIFFPVASSYIALQFTGSTPFTGMSGVKKELKLAVPLYLSGVAVSVVLLILYKVKHLGLI